MKRDRYSERTTGYVTGVKECWWIKINTKPVRSHSLDGAVFPHIITVEYRPEENGNNGENGKNIEQVFRKKKYVSYKAACPHIGDRVPVSYDRQRPGKAAVEI